MKWGFLSYGLIAPKVHESLSQIPTEQIVAVASKSNHLDLAASLNPSIRVYADYKSLTQDPEIDIIYISSTHNFHYEHTMLCLQAGKHVICEKPLSLNTQQTQEMILQAKASNCFLMEALWMAYLPGVQQCKKLIDQGTIGEVRFLTANFSFDSTYDPDRRWLNPALAGGGIYDVGVYPLAFANLILNQIPTKVQSAATRTTTGVDATASIQLSYATGAMAQLFCGVQLQTEHQAIIYGTKGHIVFPKFWKGESFTVITEEHSSTHHHPYTSTGYYHELIHACEQIAAGSLESSIFGWEASLHQAMLVDEILVEVGIC